MPEEKTKNIPHVSRTEAYLKTRDLIKNPIHVFEKYRKALGPTFSFYFGGAKRSIISSEPDFIKHILNDNHKNYRKSDIQVKRMAEFQGVGLLNSHGDYWLKQRRLLSMGFSRSRLADLLPLQIKVLKDFMKDFDEMIDTGPVDIYEQMVRFTLRSMGKSLFGTTMKNEELDNLGVTISNIQEFMVRQIFQPYLIPWYKIIGETGRYQKMRREADQIVIDYVSKRRKEGNKELDFLQQILETPYKDTGEFMSDEQVRIEILQLLVAGNETSSNSLSWIFYLLAKNPEHIVKIRKEAEEVFGNGEVNYAGLHSLQYSLNVLDEALRLYPPFWLIDRIALEDDEVCGIKVPAGTLVMPYIYGVHHNPDFWEAPETFNPDRFEKNAKDIQHPYAHIPFGAGPRVCIGQNMAIMQILLVLVTIIRKYDFRLHSGQEIDIHPMIILRPGGPVNLDVTRI
jgi:cytochrome P450